LKRKRFHEPLILPKRSMCTTRQFDNERDRHLVVSHPAIPPLPEACRPALRPLTAEAANQLWREVIARRWRPLTRFLPSNHWSHQFTAVGPDWVTSWNSWLSNKPDSPDPVRAFLTYSLSWGDSETIYFVLSGQSIFCLSWSIFLTHWHYFLHTDQDVLIVTPGRSQFVCFGETGLLGVGIRPLSSHFDDRGVSDDCDCQL
jgi:Protein of unknown function (DUF2947)